MVIIQATAIQITRLYAQAPVTLIHPQKSPANLIIVDSIELQLNLKNAELTLSINNFLKGFFHEALIAKALILEALI